VHGNTVRNVTSSGIKVASCSSVQVCHNFCADSYSGITVVQSVHGCKFDNNTCLRGSYGFYVAGSYQNILSDNVVKGYIYGISIEMGSINNRINLNNCSSNSYSGIFLMEDSNTVTSNKIYSNGYSGIQVNQADSCVLTDNICVNNPRGIYASGANHVTLNGNNCSRNTQYGFFAASCENISTNENKLYLNGANGIYLSQCKNSYMWYDVIGQSADYGFVATQSSWIYTTASSTYNGISGFWILDSDNCTISSANASHNTQNGVVLENCHKCRVIDSNIMANSIIGILTSNSDNSSILRVRAYQNLEAVELSYSDHENVSDCHFLGNHHGIWLNDATWIQIWNNQIANGGGSGILMFGASGSANCTIGGNSISGFTTYGVQISSSMYTILEANVISNNGNGIRMTGVSHITVVSNVFTSDGYGVYLSASDVCDVSSNEFNNIPNFGIYALNSDDGVFLLNTFHGVSSGIGLEACNGCLLVGNQCDASMLGIYVLNSSGTGIYSGKCNDSTHDGGSIGIYVHGGAGTIIQNMNLTGCGFGLLMEVSASDVITNNVFWHNQDAGVAMYGCMNVILHHNQFIFNHGSTGEYSIAANQAYDDGQNRWNTSGPDGTGNFWSDWCYPDIDRDGIVDSSFFIIGGAYDYFPIADTTAPVVSITNPCMDGVVYTTSSVSFSWDATDTWSGLDHFEVYMDEGSWQDVGYGNVQTWSALLEGQHHLHVKAVDKAGNEATTVRSFFIDVSAPEVTISAPGNNTAVNDNTTSFSWTGTDAGTGNAYYHVGWDMGDYIPIGSANSYTITSPLADGAHRFYLRASDSNDHIRVYYIDFYVDTIAPSLDSISPSDGSVIIVSEVPVYWYAFDMASTLSGMDRTEVRLDESAWVNEGLGSTHIFQEVSEGFHTLYVKSFDKAGNSVEKQSRFMVDFTLPTVSILSPANHTIYSINDVTITWSGSDQGSGIDHFDVGMDSGPMTSQGTSTSLTFTGLMDGSHNINVMAVDKSGKIRVAYVNIIVDTTAPMLSITTPTEGGFYSVTDFNVTWTSMEFGSGIASYEVRVDNGEWQSRGTSSYALMQIAEGRHTIYVKATDMAGNIRSASVNIINDLNPPIINSLTPADGSLVNTENVVFSWNATDAIEISSFTYGIDSDIGHGLMSGTSSVSVTMTSGQHSFKLTVMDRAGRQTVGYVNLTVDTVAPTIVARTPSVANAGVNDKISFRFSETVNSTGMSVLVNGLESAPSLNGTTYEVSKTLVGGTDYTIRIAGAKDIAGNAMEAFTWSFKVVSGEQSPGKFVISGTMVDKNGQAVSGALVSVGGQTLATNDQGQFSVYLGSGEQQLHVTAPGMVEFIKDLSVTSDQQLGQLTIIAVADSPGQDGVAPAAGDITPFLIIGMVVALGAVIALIVIVKKRRS
jgi:parallel beta-helix repeat protein